MTEDPTASQTGSRKLSYSSPRNPAFKLVIARVAADGVLTQFPAAASTPNRCHRGMASFIGYPQPAPTSKPSGASHALNESTSIPNNPGSARFTGELGMVYPELSQNSTQNSQTPPGRLCLAG